METGERLKIWKLFVLTQRNECEKLIINAHYKTPPNTPAILIIQIALEVR